MANITDILVIAGIIVVALITLGLILSRLYQRASKEVSFVRTGFGGQKVIINGGALVFPVLHEVIPVNMNTLRLEVRRANEHFESVLRLDGSAFSELADEEQNLARDLATTALARLESATTSRSLKTAVEVLPKPEDVRAGVDPRALSHASEDSTWTVYSANLAFEYGDIEDEEERLLAVIEGLLESAPETLHLSEAELADLGLFPS